MKCFFLILGILVGFSSCALKEKPSSIIPKEKMTEIMSEVFVVGDDDRMFLMCHSNSVVSFVSIADFSSPFSNQKLSKGVQVSWSGEASTVSFVVRIELFSKISTAADKDSIFVRRTCVDNTVKEVIRSKRCFVK
jgi:hypothetical protein